ncbi:MAG: HEAT repeat domain-containing protein, partial [Phycisphaerae bacterium]|nr:HEAT repeat domain-containing protein [Phycisphaerae bacterium]
MAAASAALCPPAFVLSATSAPGADPVTTLTDAKGNVSQDDRDEAARRLLARHTDEARKILRDTLVSPDIGGELAVARSLEQDPNPDPAFIDPLFPLLLNRDLAAAAGRALAGYKGNTTVMTRLIDRATSPRNSPEFSRIAAIRAIGTMPERRAAAALMQLLTSGEESGAIHKAAAEALVEMTGLEQNGSDPTRWNAWWAGQQDRTDSDFRQDINAHQEARLDRLQAHVRSLDTETESILRDQYHAADNDQKTAMALRFLHSTAPEIREIGTRLVNDDVTEGRQPTAAELARLRDMVSDSSPDVRRAVADIITKLNDPESLDVLLVQLQVEPDPRVRGAIATALGPMRDLRAVPTLVKLLNDDSLSTAEDAARALSQAATGPLANDAALARTTAEALRNAVLARAKTPGTEDFCASCIEAIAPLHQPQIVQELADAKLMNSQGKAVRQAMVLAMGELRDPKFADPIVDALNDPDDDVQRQAIASLGMNPAAGAYAQNVGNILRSDSGRKDAVREEAWRFMASIFPQLKEEQLESWAQQFAGDPARHIVVLQALSDKQKAAGKLEDLAT